MTTAAVRSAAHHLLSLRVADIVPGARGPRRWLRAARTDAGRLRALLASPSSGSVEIDRLVDPLRDSTLEVQGWSDRGVSAVRSRGRVLHPTAISLPAAGEARVVRITSRARPPSYEQAPPVATSAARVNDGATPFARPDAGILPPGPHGSPGGGSEETAAGAKHLSQVVERVLRRWSRGEGVSVVRWRGTQGRDDATESTPLNAAFPTVWGTSHEGSHPTTEAPRGGFRFADSAPVVGAPHAPGEHLWPHGFGRSPELVSLHDVVRAAAIPTGQGSHPARRETTEMFGAALERITAGIASVESLLVTGTSEKRGNGSAPVPSSPADVDEGVAWLDDDDLAARLQHILHRQTQRRGIDLS